MKQCAAVFPARRLRKVGIAGLCVLWLLLSCAAVSPALHGWLHDLSGCGHVCEDDFGGEPESGEAPHVCSVFFLQSGVLPAAPAAALVPTAVPEVRLAFFFIQESGSGALRTADARAPPCSSVV